MLPNPASILAQVPCGLHVTIRDAAGRAVDAVLVTATSSRSGSQYGLPMMASDTIYTLAPYTPPASRLAITRSGATQTRIISAIAVSGVLVAISLEGVG